MSIQSVSKNFRLAIIAVLAASGLSALPAQAQVIPRIQHCYVPASGAGMPSCGTVQIQLQVVGRFPCGPPVPGGNYCGVNTFFQVRARLLNIDGIRTVGAQVNSMFPWTCNISPTTSWSAWCEISPTTQAPTVHMMSVTVPAI